MASHVNELEEYVSDLFKEFDKYSRPTIASGATPIEKGDVKNPYFMCECKIRNTESFTVNYDVWKKIQYEASGTGKDAVYIIQNKSKERLAVMDLDEWINMVYEIIELRNENERLSKGKI